MGVISQIRRDAMYVKVSVLVVVVCVCGCIDAQSVSCDESSVRLQGLSVPSAGRVEVCVGGVWGTVCSPPNRNGQWSLKNAQVVCRELGYITATNTLPLESLTFHVRAGDQVPIHVSQVECDGTETALLNCAHTSAPPSTCSHLTDAFIVCRAGEAISGDVRLLGDTADYRGAVEYYDTFLGWTGICADPAHAGSWLSSRAAEIVCAQLGYEGGQPFFQNISSLALQVSNLECSEGVFTLDDCSRPDSVVFSGGCLSQDAGWVECRETEASDFSLRLVGGEREGIVEVAYNGRWGTVCEDELWSIANVQVACEELGLTTESGYSTIPSTSYEQYMSLLKPYWLTSVSCVAGDERIEDCTRDPILGYSDTCNTASTISIFNSAEINCGDPIPFSLGGGPIAGIVIAVLTFVTVVTLSAIYLPERWKRRHTYPLWVKLTTPSRWCENISCPNCRRFRQRRTATTTTVATRTGPTASSSEYPPPTHRSPRSESAEGSSATTSRQEQEERGANTVIGFSVAPPTSSEPAGDLMAPAPPPYQAAVSYPTASGVPAPKPFPDLPPIYTEKGIDPSAVSLPYPTATSDPAYPPPALAPSNDLPYPS